MRTKEEEKKKERKTRVFCIVNIYRRECACNSENKKKKGGKKDILSCLSRSSENLYVREGRKGISDSSEMIDWEGRKKILEKRTRGRWLKKKGEVEKELKKKETRK